jgi:hypothetical protein
VAKEFGNAHNCEERETREMEGEGARYIGWIAQALLPLLRLAITKEGGATVVETALTETSSSLACTTPIALREIQGVSINTSFAMKLMRIRRNYMGSLKVPTTSLNTTIPLLNVNSIVYSKKLSNILPFSKKNPPIISRYYELDAPHHKINIYHIAHYQHLNSSPSNLPWANSNSPSPP